MDIHYEESILVAQGQDAVAAAEQRQREEARRQAEAAAQRQEEEIRRQEEAARTRREAERQRQEEARQQAEAVQKRPQPGEVFRDCPTCPEMVVVPAGSFRMGSPSYEEYRDEDEGPMHRVTIAEPFAVGVYEVTVGEFGRFADATGHAPRNWCSGLDESDDGRSWRNPGYRQSERHPVVCVSWDDAQAYVGWLTQQTDKAYRLLSEAEWEYVARAGTTTTYHWGDRIGRNRANCDSCGSRWDDAQAAPGGSFTANGWEYTIYTGMSGNGWRIVGTPVITGHRRMVQRGRVGIVGRVLRAAAPGSTPRVTSARPHAIPGSAPDGGITVVGSALPGVWISIMGRVNHPMTTGQQHPTDERWLLSCSRPTLLSGGVWRSYLGFGG